MKYDVYKIKKNGDIISTRFGKKKLLKARIGTNGYKAVTLYYNKNPRQHLIHILVMEKHGPCKPTTGTTYKVDHRDGNPLNNHINNLQWLTQSDNVKKGKLKTKLTEKMVKHIRKTRPNVKGVTSLASKYDVSKQAIYNVLANRSHTHIK